MLVGPLSFVFVWGNQIKIVVKWLIPILISHFSRTHSVSRSPSKLHWNLFERFFLDVHLAFTCAPASVHLTRKNAYAVVETEDRNGSLTLTQTASLSSSWMNKPWPNCSCWYFWSLLLDGEDNLMLYVILREETAWVRWRRTVPILFICMKKPDY